MAEVAAAWRATRAGRRRARPWSGAWPRAIGFLARPAAIDELLGRHRPRRRRPASARAGAAVKGISALEIGLFGDGSDALADPGRPAALRLPRLGHGPGRTTAGAAVLADWTDGYRDTFVAGMDGDPQSSVDAIVNELIFRVTELDDQGLRALVGGDRPRRPARQPHRRPGRVPRSPSSRRTLAGVDGAAGRRRRRRTPARPRGRALR